MPASTSPQIIDNGKSNGQSSRLAFALEQLASSQRRNAEAASEMTKITANSALAAWQKQWQLFNELVSAAQNGHQDFWVFASPDQLVTKRAAVAKASVEKALAGTREITDLFLKSGNEAADIWAKRLSGSLAELQAVAGKP
jgi:phasin family protein